jgi:putative MATE family efflux protein
MEPLLGLFDLGFVARLGPQAMAIVGITESLMLIVMAIASGVSVATAAVVSRRMGEKRVDAVCRATVQGALVALVVSLSCALVGVLVAPQLLRIMGGDEALVAAGASFVRVMLASSVPLTLLVVLSACLRATGDAATSLRALLVAYLINLVLDPLLIYGLASLPRLGVTGAAVAACVGRGLGVVYILAHLLSGRGRIRLRSADFHIDAESTIRLLGSSLVAAGQFLAPIASWLSLVRILTPFGTPVIAGYTITLRIVVFFLGITLEGVSSAGAVLVGQNLGARRPDRAERTAKVIGWYAMWGLLASALTLGFFAPAIASLFTSDAETQSFAVTSLRFLCTGSVFAGWGVILSEALNGAGDATAPLVINIGSYLVVQIPLAFMLARVMGAKGVFVAVVASEALQAVLAALAFRFRNWKARQV